jgi:outer membrane protein assembly factor BamD (BamD/ComL family)
MNKEMKKRVLSILTILGILLLIILTGIIHAWYEEQKDMRLLYAEGMRYYHRKDHDNASKCFRKAARKGHEKSKAMLEQLEKLNQ